MTELYTLVCDSVGRDIFLGILYGYKSILQVDLQLEYNEAKLNFSKTDRKPQNMLSLAPTFSVKLPNYYLLTLTDEMPNSRDIYRKLPKAQYSLIQHK